MVTFSVLAQQHYNTTYILNEDTQPVIRAIGVSHTACKDEFRQKKSISQLKCIFIFYNINSSIKYCAIYSSATLA